jgi:hypothetical protein
MSKTMNMMISLHIERTSFIDLVMTMEAKIRTPEGGTEEECTGEFTLKSFSDDQVSTIEET